MKQSDGFLTAETSGNIKVLTETEIKAGFTEGDLIRDDEVNFQLQRHEKDIQSMNRELVTVLDAEGISPNQNLDNQVLEALDSRFQPKGQAGYSKGYINGGVASSNATTPDSIVDITAVKARSSDDTQDINVDAGSLDITSASDWASGVVPSLISTSIHIWADYNSGTPRFILDDATGSNISGAKRRVGSFITDSSGDIIKFYTFGEGNTIDYFYNADITDFTSITTNFVQRAISVPDGIKVKPFLKINGTEATYVYTTYDGSTDIYQGTADAEINAFTEDGTITIRSSSNLVNPEALTIGYRSFR